ncbi:MAG: hypothetical protein RLZZ584_3393 [Pseudomonadota bacterium]
MHRCHHCRATSYRQVIARDDQGAMRATGRYRCTGCSVVFSNVREWREGLVRPQPRETGLGVFQPLTTGSTG